mmetsp:Transcript_125157/g.325178  ORF Transcript_125157/g.325178 Transcript_125157/m.325178 type:complete len:758 (-) Transcript_125157:36-2309(-)
MWCRTSSPISVPGAGQQPLVRRTSGSRKRSKIGLLSDILSECPQNVDEIDRAHLHPDVEDVQAVGSWPQVYGASQTRVPVTKQDALRCAKVTALGLPVLTESHYPQIKKLVAEAGRYYGVSQACLTVADHKYNYPKFIWVPDLAKRVAFRKIPSCAVQMARFVEGADGKAFIKGAALKCLPGGSLCVNRGSTPCNLAIALGLPVVIPDARKDPLAGETPGDVMSVFPFYASVPIFSMDGLVVCSLCIYDKTARPKFSDDNLAMLEALADRIARHIQMLEMPVPASIVTDAPGGAGVADEVTVVFTDVEGSTSLWEASPEAMHQALELHDEAIRRLVAKHHGYEITTEGDAFQLAFHSAFAALGFCLELQTELLQCPWPAAILEHQAACASPDGAWRGLRVRMGLHTGRPSSVSRHDVTGRLSYAGPSVRMAKAIEGACHGGQILASAACFRHVDGLLPQLGSPQVVDLGEHVLKGVGLSEATPGEDGLAAVRLVQLLPKAIAPVYQRGGTAGGAVNHVGRTFPAVGSLRQVSPGFHESPGGETVALAFVMAKTLKDLLDNPSDLADTVAVMYKQCLRGVLRDSSRSGYECQELEGTFMLAFEDLEDAVRFAHALRIALRDTPWPEELRHYGPAFEEAGLQVSFGALSSGYVARCPHVSTGRADYFGTICNRSARITAAAPPGVFLLGGDLPANVDVVPSDLQATTRLTRLGRYTFKGVQESIAVHEICTVSSMGTQNEEQSQDLPVTCLLSGERCSN